MKPISQRSVRLPRRRFLAGMAAAAGGSVVARAGEPAWADRLTVTVGPQSGDLVGTGDRVLQAAIDRVARLGGGTVRILPGTYTLRSAVHLAPRVRLVGSGPETVITRGPSVRAALAADTDWFAEEIVLAAGAGFEPGDGVVLEATHPDQGRKMIVKRTLVDRDGDRFRLDRAPRENLWLSSEASCATLFPLLSGDHVDDVVIENLTLDGNRANCELLDGNYGGCVFLQDCNRWTLRGVVARAYHGDGISFQICHDVEILDCHSHDHAHLGLHPGSGSRRPVIRGNRFERNSQGIYWCWGVRHGLAEDNTIADNSLFGVSIGHRDTDNLMRANRILRSGRAGVRFRDFGRAHDASPHRTTLERNLIEDSGGPDGIAIEICASPRDVRLVGNTITETRGPERRIGIRIGAEAGPVELSGNTFRGLARDVEDLRVGAVGTGAVSN
jgi:hypothetical protein